MLQIDIKIIIYSKQFFFYSFFCYCLFSYFNVVFFFLNYLIIIREVNNNTFECIPPIILFFLLG